MTRPFFFISHKHVDRDIGLTLAEFLREEMRGNVDVHLSSSSAFEGPRVGKDLNDELKSALAKTQVLFLVFTDEGQDWSYCMWECGVATDPSDATHTNVVVVQCGTEAPVVYGTSLRVDANSLESIESMVIQLCTSDSFVPGHTEPLTGYDRREERLRERARSLYDSLQPKLARLGRAKTQRVTSPLVRIELPGASIQAIAAAERDRREDVAVRVLLEDARIESSSRAELLFGVAIGPNTTMARLSGLETTPRTVSQAPAWVQSIVRQIVAALREELAPVPWAPFEQEGGRLHLPFVGTYSLGATDEPCQFDISFMPVRSPEVLARDRMLLMENVASLRLGEVDAGDVLLRDLVVNARSRVPIIDGAGVARMIAHRSMIMEFVAARSFAGLETAGLTLQDLLNDEDMATMFESSFTTIKSGATLEESRLAMARMPGCQDVFVTEDGSRDSKVLGWLTNVMFLGS